MEEIGELNLIVLTLDIRAWHMAQLITPASQPFKPTVLCLKQSISALIF